jgi:hypothetical protein
MMPTILKILLVFICEQTMPMNYCAKHEILRNCCSCFAHHVKGMNVATSIVILLKSDSSTLINPNVAASIEIRAPNTPNSSVTNLTSSTLVEVGVRLSQNNQ